MRQEPRPGDIVAGKYRVRAILGRGRGTLVEAENVSFEQRVAIRIVSPQLGDNVEIGKFRREARALAKLGSEHVARIIDVGNLQDGSFYLVRQYLEGLDVARYLKGRRTLGVEEAIGWVLQATEAVAETHAYGILLRELSPSHLFLADRSPGVRSGPRVLKVIDFGTSKLLRENSDSAVEEFTSTTLTGISPYSSPEMLRRQKDLDVRTDVWSLGAILYEMLSGRPPFGSDTLSLAIAITRDNPAPLGQLRRDVPPEVEEAVMRSLAKDRNQRTADTHAFAASLARFAPPEGRALMERIRDLAASARNRANGGSSDDEELEVSEVEELSDDGEEEAATRVGRVADIMKSGALPTPGGQRGPQQPTVAAPGRMAPPPGYNSGRGPVDEPTAPRNPSRTVPTPSPPAAPAPRAITQEKTEALGVNFNFSPNLGTGSPSAPPGPVFAGAAVGSNPNAPKPTQVLPALLDNPRASLPAMPGLPPLPAPPKPSLPPDARASLHPDASSSPGMIAPAMPLGAAESQWGARSAPAPSNPGAYGPPGMQPTGMQTPGMQPTGGLQPKNAFGRKLALMVVLGAGFALALMIVVLVVLPSGGGAASSASAAASAAPESSPRPPTQQPTAAVTSDPVPTATPSVTSEVVASATPSAEPSAAPSATAKPRNTNTVATTSQPVATSKPTATPTATATVEPAKPGEQGTLVLVAVGGTCAFSVNGASKGTTNSVKLSVAPGNYAVTCKPASGASRSRSASVKAGKTAMITFKL